MKSLLRALLCLSALTSLRACAGLDGLSASYTRRIGGQSVTGFVAGDGSYGLVARPAK